MRAVIIGTDFMRDTDGSFKAIETNTGVGLEVNTIKYIDTGSITEFVLNNNFEELHFIYSLSNIVVSTLENPDDDDMNLASDNLATFLSSSICLPNNIEYVPHLVDVNSITIPFIEDTDNKLIIRVSYDTTALIDDTYAKDNWEFLKLMYDNDPNSIPKCYINDDEFGIDSIGITLRDNGNHPNYCIKKRITPSDNKVYPTLYKINTLEQLEEIKSNLEVDEYIQEYIYNTDELMYGKSFHYRSVDLVYGSELNSLNLYTYQKTNLLPIVENCDFDNNNKIQSWDRPRYLSKVLNGQQDISVKLDADETTQIVMPDNTIKSAEELNVNDIVKSIGLGNIQVDSTSASASFSEFSENYYITSSKLITKDTFEYYGPIISIELDNGSKFSDVTHGRIFKVEESYVKLCNYENLEIGDTLILINNENNAIETKIVQNIEYSFETLTAYRIDIEESDVFLSMEETENQSIYAILTHNYNYDCQLITCQAGFSQYIGVSGFRCEDNSFGPFGPQSAFGCGQSQPACKRVDGPVNADATYNGSPAAWAVGQPYQFYLQCETMGVYTSCNGLLPTASVTRNQYCNGQKPSDVQLKKNIAYSHTLPRGLKIYTFEFIDEFVQIQKEFNNDDYSGKWQGVLAQELIDTNYEDCINLREDGYFEVNYTKLNLELKKIK
jgi:hypothetical protein